ncbi:hypothetical protein CHU98_g1814 [Xylaria longipes]|nr:hypothetical protein CHU98_g1814 [Xylaria longipes]
MTLGAEVALITMTVGLTYNRKRMLGLGGKLFNVPEHIGIGEKVTRGCVWAYDAMPSGMMPEICVFLPCPTKEACSWEEETHEGLRGQTLPEGFENARDPRYILRPEAIESVFYIYRITGEKEYQPTKKATETELAFSAIAAVTSRLIRLQYRGPPFQAPMSLIEAVFWDAKKEEFRMLQSFHQLPDMLSYNRHGGSRGKRVMSLAAKLKCFCLKATEDCASIPELADNCIVGGFSSRPRRLTIWIILGLSSYGGEQLRKVLALEDDEKIKKVAVAWFVGPGGKYEHDYEICQDNEGFQETFAIDEVAKTGGSILGETSGVVDESAVTGGRFRFGTLPQRLVLRSILADVVGDRD